MIEAYCCDICTEMGLGTTRSKFLLAFGHFSFRWRAVGISLHLQEPLSTDLPPFLRLAPKPRTSPALEGLAPSTSVLFSTLTSVDVLAGHQAGVPRNLRLVAFRALRSRPAALPLPHASLSLCTKSETRIFHQPR